MVLAIRNPRADTMRPFLFGFVLVSASACKSLAPAGSEALSGTPVLRGMDCTQRMSDIGFAVAQELSSRPKKLNFWDLSCNNELAKDWLILTPAPQLWTMPYDKLPRRDTCDKGEKCDAELHTMTCESDADCAKGRCASVAYAPTKMCTDHSEVLFSQLFDLVSRAKQRVEATTLGGPDEPYTTVFRRAVQASRKMAAATPGGNEGTLDFRFLGTGELKDSQGLLDNLAKGVLTKLDEGASPLPVRISTGVYGGRVSWNHAKIVVVDGEEAIVGGHNWWASDYNRDKPLYDVSMRARGGAALAAQRYVEWLWRDPKYAQGLSLPSGKAADARLAPFPATNGEAVRGTVPILAVGTEGGFQRGNNPDASDVALYTMIDKAKAKVVISQMELVSPAAKEKHTGWDYPQFISSYLIDHLAKALMRDVKIYVVLSSIDTSDGVSASYAHGWSLPKIATEIKKRMVKTLGKSAGGDAALTKRLCENFHLAYIRTSEENKPLLNHAKVMAVDDKVFYIGSQNLYPGGMADMLAPQLSEFGWIVDDKDAARTFNQTYWEPLWKHSRRTAISGSEATVGQCTFLLPPATAASPRSPVTPRT